MRLQSDFCPHPSRLLPAAALLLSCLGTARALDYPTTILGDHPAAYYRMEETDGTTMTDASGAGRDGNYFQDGSYPSLGQPGIDTNSIALHAAGNLAYGTAGYFPELNPQGPFSFEIWVRPTSAPGPTDDYRCPIGNFGGWATGGGYGSGWYVYQTPGSASTFAFVLAPTTAWISTSYSLFTWYHLVGTYDGTNASFYVNGQLIGTQAAAGFLPNPAAPLCFGQRADSYGYFDGDLDEAAIYTNVLTLSQVQAHYQVGTNSFRAQPTGPSVTTDPASTTNYAGHNIHLAVLADGTAPLSYQWYKASGAITDATSATLDFIANMADSGQTYRVIITNNYGSATSAWATVTVSPGLSINAQPSAISRRQGSKAAFLVAAEGALPLSYQWYKGANAIQDATNQTLWLSNLKLTDDQSSYYAKVSNPYTFTNSDPAILTVTARTDTAPTNLYSKIVMLDDPVAYWRLDETSSSIALDAVGSFDGTYDDNGGAGTFSFGAASGVTHSTSDAAVGITNGARVIVPYALELNPWGPFSIEGWFQPASTAADGNDYRTAFSSMNNPGGAGPTGWLLYQQGNNTWAWVPYGGFWASVFITDTADTVVANQWYHIALTYDGSLFTVYVNGTAKTSATYAGFAPNGSVPAGGAGIYNYTYAGGGALDLGWRSDNGFNPFAGKVDEVAVYNKALSATQIESHYVANVRLTATVDGQKVILSWPVGTLQSATSAGGTYSNMDGITSPYTNAAPSGSLYYRVKLQ